MLVGACDGSLACSTCHVILEQSHYDALPPPEEEEEDMLDLAFGLTDTSRLGCQIKIDASMKGMVLQVSTYMHVAPISRNTPHTRPLLRASTRERQIPSEL